MDPMTLVLILGLGGGTLWLRKNKPALLPKFLQPAAGTASAKSAAVAAVVAASKPTPAATAGLDPGMTSAQVAAANALLAANTDAAAMYSLASNYSDLGFNNTAKALIAKADALSTTAKAQGASDCQLLQQMMTAGTPGAGTTP